RVNRLAALAKSTVTARGSRGSRRAAAPFRFHRRIANLRLTDAPLALHPDRRRRRRLPHRPAHRAGDERLPGRRSSQRRRSADHAGRASPAAGPARPADAGDERPRDAAADASHPRAEGRAGGDHLRLRLRVGSGADGRARLHRQAPRAARAGADHRAPVAAAPGHDPADAAGPGGEAAFLSARSSSPSPAMIWFIWSANLLWCESRVSPTVCGSSIGLPKTAITGRSRRRLAAISAHRQLVMPRMKAGITIGRALIASSPAPGCAGSMLYGSLVLLRVPSGWKPTICPG